MSKTTTAILALNILILSSIDLFAGNKTHKEDELCANRMTRHILHGKDKRFYMFDHLYKEMKATRQAAKIGRVLATQSEAQVNKRFDKLVKKMRSKIADEREPTLKLYGEEKDKKRIKRGIGLSKILAVSKTHESRVAFLTQYKADRETYARAQPFKRDINIAKLDSKTDELAELGLKQLKASALETKIITLINDNDEERILYFLLGCERKLNKKRIKRKNQFPSSQPEIDQIDNALVKLASVISGTHIAKAEFLKELLITIKPEAERLLKEYDSQLIEHKRKSTYLGSLGLPYALSFF